MQEVTKYTVDVHAANLRLDLFLTKTLTGISRSQIQKLISEGNVQVNNLAAGKNTRLKEGDSIEVLKDVASHDNFIKPQDISFEILYEDEFIVAVNKPAGLVVHPGNGVHDGTLVNGLVFKMQALSDGFESDRPGIVHRLDKDTSGVLLVAKNNQAHSAMASMFQDRLITKNYIGFCIGAPVEQHGMISLSLDRSRQDPMKRAPSEHGKIAKTEYFVIQSKSGISAIRFKPYTGRTHQIRVHASSKGFPIIGDKLYGGGNERLLRISPLDRPFAYSILKCFKRHALHAFSIQFTHPFLKKDILITAPLPDDFKDAAFKFGSTNIFG